jgi:hypothetical protein
LSDQASLSSPRISFASSSNLLLSTRRMRIRSLRSPLAMMRWMSGEQAGLVPDGEAERAHGAMTAPAAQEILGPGDERLRRLPVGCLQHAPMAGARPAALAFRHGEHLAVEMCGDAAHHLALALGQEQSRFGMLEPRVGARIDEAVDLRLERRNPVRIAPVHRPGEIDEFLAVAGILDRADDDGGRGQSRGGGHGPS